MFDNLNTINATKYKVLTNWLKEQLENNKEIQMQDLELMLFSLDIEIKHKVQNLESKSE